MPRLGSGDAAGFIDSTFNGRRCRTALPLAKRRPHFKSCFCRVAVHQLEKFYRNQRTLQCNVQSTQHRRVNGNNRIVLLLTSNEKLLPKSIVKKQTAGLERLTLDIQVISIPCLNSESWVRSCWPFLQRRVSTQTGGSTMSQKRYSQGSLNQMRCNSTWMRLLT